MARAPHLAAAAAITGGMSVPQEKRHRCIFDIPPEFFDACRLLSSSASATGPAAAPVSDTSGIKSKNSTLVETLDQTHGEEEKTSRNDVSLARLTCNTCEAEFESLQDQRSHFKSDIHRINVKLSIAGKDIVKEDDFDELTSDSLKDCDISSISGSEDEAEKGPSIRNEKGSVEGVKQKLFVRLQTGERVSLWKCLVLNENENINFEDCKAVSFDNGDGLAQYVSGNEVVERLKFLVHEPRDKTHFRIVLLASGGHFAGCVFDGNSVVVHKTFHRYVVRAKAGKKQSSKDAAGRSIHSAGAALRRHNEFALKKDIQELLATWKPYFDASSCVFIHAPSSNRQLLFDGHKAYFSQQHSVVRNVPLNVRRPTFKEAQRIYSQLTQIAYEVDEKELPLDSKEDSMLSESTVEDGNKDSTVDNLNNGREATEASSSHRKSDELSISSESESEVRGTTTPLHEAAQSGNAQKVLELLKQGLDPSMVDERGRTPYMLANEKEIRNTFRRFMALNLDKWDWNAAKVPSALTREMEESQAAKQAEKDAKRKARAKESKKLRKAREKKAQAEAATSQAATAPHSVIKGLSQNIGGMQLSKEEELKRAQAIEREKRAAAAERRMAAAAALKAQGSSSTTMPSMTPPPKTGAATDISCSYCYESLAGKVPFHRYNYKYCSTTCMHVHKEILEDG